jgi:Asp-tRNA(Asn)/Glu-tRNA(Gln) amidotransferase A subunit family amidase
MTSKRQEIINMSFEDLRLELANCNYTATEVLLAFQAKAILVHDKTNCVTGFIEDALERARQLDLLPKGQRKPLHGLPISCKVCGVVI